MFRKFLALCTVLALSLTMFTACGGGSGTGNSVHGETDPLLPITATTAGYTVPAGVKIGLICIHDENSTYDKNFMDAMNRAKETLKLADDQLIVKTNIPESDACYTAACELADKGCSIIFADSFGHEPYVAQAAEKYPNVQFCHATGDGAASDYKDLPNMHNMFAAIYEGRYLAGIAAGMKLNEMIAAGKFKAEEAIIGYVGAFTYAEVISGMTSFFLGARSVCPTATMKVRYTGSWFDQGKEQEAANALITEDKCVLISQHADSLGAPTACQLAGVPNVSYNGSTYSAGKTSFLISSAINWTPYYIYAIGQVVKGEPIDKNWTGTIATGSVVLSGLNRDVAAEGTAEALEAAIAKFKAGTLHVFDTSTWTLNGEHLTEYLADVDGDFTGEVNVIHDGYFDESGKEFRSAPYFDIIIDGVTNINVNFG